MGHSVLPRSCQGAIGCEKKKTVARQLPSVQRPPVQSNCCNDSGRHVGAGFGRRSSISRRVSANSRPRDRHLGHLERDVSTVPDHPRADLDQLLAQRGQRPLLDPIRQGQRPR